MLDPTITLFGKIIQVNGEVEVEDSPCSNYESSVEKPNFEEHHEDEVDKEVTEEESLENDELNVLSEEAMDESTNAPAMSENTDQADKASNDTNKQLMKPDKIVPCPRCNSMDTKFCYYNNYNVNQPRYFCRNCQRYWTAGGTMRNVPVGAGRRKNKTSASRYCQITVSEALNGVHQPGMKTNGTVLTFGSDYPLCDSRAVENGDDRSSGSTVTTSSMEDRSKKHLNGFNNQMQMQCFQWPYMWNPAFPMPIYPHPYWNGAPIPWNGPQVPTQMSSGSNTNSPTLGKHTRDGEIISPSHINRSSRTSTTTSTSTVLIPKTLRIDDPDEAAKSSIWTTLGIKKDKGDPIIRKGFFNSFQFMRAEKNDCEVEAPQALFMANPVALCRSFSFQEKA